MKNLSANYTIKTLNSLIGNESLIQKKIADPNRRGLYFQPSKNSLTAIFRSQKDGMNFQVKIGSYPFMSLHEIYSSWTELRQKIDNGIDPQKEKELISDLNFVFEDFYNDYIVHNRKHPTAVMNIYNCHVRNKIGHLRFDQITLIECRDLIDSIKKNRSNRTAETVYSILKQCFLHQHARGYLEPQATNPFLILKKPTGYKTIRDRLITDEELNILWKKLHNKREPVTELACKLLIHTACRVNEINNNTWDNVDWQNKSLIIPKELDKESTKRLKPLSDQSMNLLDQLRYYNGNQEKLVGVDRNALGKKIARISKSHNLLDEKGRHFHAHDLRSYFSTNARKIGLDRTIIESYLSHVTERGASANYAFYDYQDEKRELACKWSNYVDSVVTQ